MTIPRWSAPGGVGAGTDVIRFDAVDRYLVPRDVPEALAYLADRLYVAHGTGERLRRGLAARGGAVAARVLLVEGTLGLTAGAGRLELEGCGEDEGHAARWRSALPLLRALDRHGEGLVPASLGGPLLRRSILLRDYEGGGRKRLIAFPFREGEDRPAAVVKLRPHLHPGATLRSERDALEMVRAALPPPVAATVPEPLAFAEVDGAEILVLGHVDGRSAYQDQQNLFLPNRAPDAGLEAAAAWLAAFHGALGVDVTTGTGPVHGDFWSRNVLLAPRDGRVEVAGVVDWEGFRTVGHPVHDLFHFPFTWGLNRPGGRRGRRPPSEVFWGTFLEPTRVSAAVQAYLGRYCADAGLDPMALVPLCHQYVALMGRRGGKRTEREWAACHTLLENFPRPVLARCDPSSS